MAYTDDLKRLEASERLIEDQLISFLTIRLSIQQMDRSLATYTRMLRSGTTDTNTRRSLVNRYQQVNSVRGRLLANLEVARANLRVTEKRRNALLERFK